MDSNETDDHIMWQLLLQNDIYTLIRYASGIYIEDKDALNLWKLVMVKFSFKFESV